MVRHRIGSISFLILKINGMKKRKQAIELTITMKFLFLYSPPTKRSILKDKNQY